MSPYEQIMQYAHDHNIHIHPQAIAGMLAMAFRASGESVVAIDAGALDSGAAQAVALAHEIGHLETGTLRNTHSQYVPIGKDEHKAIAWSVKQLLPKRRLYAALDKCQGRTWEVAEELDLPQWFVNQAIEYYEKVKS